MSAAFEPGCYIDSHHGHYAVPEVIRFAGRAGRPIDAEMAGWLAKYDTYYQEDSYPFESIIEESDRAIDWLNERHPVDGHSWGWNDGDFGLYADEEEE